ncbi:MAG: hypothetical protein ATN31_06670 [Candidatus Epulonipiscioides saccharophilum]|nr:MAG: hypothetical protein ATN31_06670 [Epulopiscium sp. AS2M-Bin001]
MSAEGVQTVINILNGDYPKPKEVDTDIVMVTLDNLYDELSQATLYQYKTSLHIISQTTLYQ